MKRISIALAAISVLSACAVKQPEQVKEISQDVSYWFQSVGRVPDVAIYPGDPEHVLTVPSEDRNFVIVRVKNYPKPKTIPAPTFTLAKPVNPQPETTAGKKEPEVVETVIHFPFDKSGLTPKSRLQLDNLIKNIGSNLTTSKINVEAYADAKGTTEYNLKLTNRRAATVAEYIISKGAPSASVHATGMGEMAPISTNKTESGRADNRRADVQVIFKE